MPLPRYHLGDLGPELCPITNDCDLFGSFGMTVAHYDGLPKAQLAFEHRNDSCVDSRGAFIGNFAQYVNDFYPLDYDEDELLDYENDRSFLKCSFCGANFTMLQEYNLRSNRRVVCKKCDGIAQVQDCCSVEVASAFTNIVSNTENVYNRRWMHATTKKDWIKHTLHKEFTVHLGSPESALVRGYDLARLVEADTLYFHEVSIKPGAHISPSIEEDLVTDNHTGYSTSQYTLVPYLNKVEQAGHISVDMLSSYVDVMATYEVPMSEVVHWTLLNSTCLSPFRAQKEWGTDVDFMNEKEKNEGNKWLDLLQTLATM